MFPAPQLCAREKRESNRPVFAPFRAFRGPLLLATLALSGRAWGLALPAEQVEFFEKKIRPVLVSECYECHNAEKTKGGLRLDYRDGWKKGGDTGDAIVPGEPAKSLLLDSIRHTDPDLKMPDKAPKLEESVIADFEKWIAMGAPDPRDEPPSPEASKPSWKDTLAVRRNWWSLQPLQKPAVPAVKDSAWSEHPIDRFLLAKMEAKDLAPAAPADARTFLRRLTFTLTGLPPTPEEVEAFVAESIRNPQSAISNATTRLLSSPRFGEHWGRHWLDLMRYAETHGSEGDPEIRGAWRYRDYIVRAFNDDVPVDQLIREHIAGDLLPRPRLHADGFSESILGTAHLRLVEHGFQPVDTLDDQVKAIDNQIDVVSKAFLGLTVSCARCHDHKFDAVSQRDFHALYSVFASVRPAQVTIDAPERQTKNRAELEALHTRIRHALADAWLATADQLDEGLHTDRDRTRRDEEVAGKIRALEAKIADLERSARALRNPSQAPAPATVAPLAVWDFEKDAMPAGGHLAGGAVIRGGRLVLDGKGSFFHTDSLPKTLTEKTLEAWVSPATLDQKGGGVISLETTKVHGFDAIVFAEKDPRQWVPGSNNFKRSERLNARQETAAPGEFVHVAVTYAADGTITFFRNGERYGSSYTKPPLLEFPADAARVLLGLRHKGAGNGYFAGEIDEARLYDRALSATEIVASFRAGPNATIAPAEVLARLPADQRAAYSAAREELAQLRAAHASATAGPEMLRAAASDPAHPLHLWALLGALPPDRLAAEWARLLGEWQQKRAEAIEQNAASFPRMWDLAGADYARWFPYGTGLSKQPLAPGSFSIATEGDRILDGLLPAGAATGRLSSKHNGLLTSPRFRIETDSISVRAAGSGGAMVRVIVDNYPLPSNPIFPKAVLEKSQPGWVRLDTAYRKGSWAYLEFGTREDLTRPLPGSKEPKGRAPRTERSEFFVSEIVAHNGSDVPREVPAALLHLLDLPAPADSHALATRYRNLTRTAVLAWRNAQASNTQVALLDGLVRAGALPASLSALPTVAPLVTEYRRLEAEVPVLRRAPGVLETTGLDAPFFTRGDHTKPTDPIPRGFLEVIDGQPFATHLSGRLELAEKVASAQNPLTARVMANRVWQWMFGRGIAPTVDNLGRLGEKPTHPELLDYLATRLIEHGWSVKHLVREIAATRAFQMSSEASPAARTSDPANELWSHFSVRRLEAEAIRDSLLAVAGTLDAEMYGEPQDDAEPRRSIYLRVRRNALNPFLITFDAPKPFTTLGRRDATNVPGQSLTLLNSPFVIAQAQKWARRLIAQPGATAESRIEAMFSTAFARPPGAEELVSAVAYLTTLASDRKLPTDQLLTSEPIWQDFAQSLFNLKEFIYVR